MIAFDSEGSASIGVYLEDLNKDAQPTDLSRYVGIYFASRNLTTKERTETYLAPVLCSQIMTKVPQYFWNDLEEHSSLSVDELYCPDTSSFTLDYNKYSIVAYVTTCADAKTILNQPGADTDCEQDQQTIEDYIHQKVDLNSVWISQYFNLKEYD